MWVLWVAGKRRNFVTQNGRWIPCARTGWGVLPCYKQASHFGKNREFPERVLRWSGFWRRWTAASSASTFSTRPAAGTGGVESGKWGKWKRVGEFGAGKYCSKCGDSGKPAS